MNTASAEALSLQERLDFIEMDGEARKTLAGLQGVIDTSIGSALDRFYAKVRQTPAVSGFFASETHIQSAKKHQETHWARIAGAAFDGGYVAGVTAVGKAHARLGLEPRWYIGGYALILEQLLRVVVEDRSSWRFGRAKSAQLASEISAVVKAAMLDMDYAISVYLDELAEARRKAEAEKARAEANQAEALKLLGEVLSSLAEGDLQSRLSADLPPEFVEMARNFNAAAGSLHDAMAEVSRTSTSILSGAEGIAASSEDLSRRTERQAANLEESSAALHQLTQSVKLTAESAGKALAVVGKTQGQAAQSERVVADTVAAMGKIKESSGKIAAIIGVIDEIAFQTNLLALNAGVEAARAGEAGRGFAVVAQEVRSLAQRCASSAKQIKELISTSGEHVEAGVSLVGDAGDALAAMIAGINDLSNLIQSITAAAREQSQGIAEVSVAVSEMDKITQQNAAMVEQTSAETQRLKDETHELADRLERFRIARGPQHAELALPGAQDLQPIPSPARKMVQSLAASFQRAG